MAQTQERRGRKRNSRGDGAEIRLTFMDGGLPHVCKATLVDTSDQGIGLRATTAIPPGSLITFHATKGLLGLELPPEARVCWCVPLGDGSHRLGLSFNLDDESYSTAPVGEDDPIDHYEILQVNPKADADTIHRCYRMLAQRYHPDNQETGNESMFRLVLKAFRVLSDPAQRAAFDLRHRALQRARLRLFEGSDETRGAEAEKRKRQGILHLLYQKRLTNPEHPGMSIFDLEDLLTCPREHLEFALWYLKEAGAVQRSDNNRYAITFKGVDMAESLPAPFTIPEDRLLPAAPTMAS